MEGTASKVRVGHWPERPPFRIPLPTGGELDLESRPVVMGILNVTPDSFSDGGEYFDTEAAVERALAICAEGVDIIDVGGESTRPGSEPVDADEEIRRVIPVIRAVADETDLPISIDTQKAAVAAEALAAGAQIVNDVSALRTDPRMAAVAAEAGAPTVLMHMQGRPKTMQSNPRYDEVVTDIIAWLEERVEAACAAGIARERVIVDPGFGFGKTLQHNLELLRRLSEFHRLGHPVLVGTSRKSMLGTILGSPTEDRLAGTLATVCAAVLSGCHILRVHDVAETVRAVKVCEAIRRGEGYVR